MKKFPPIKNKPASKDVNRSEFEAEMEAQVLAKKAGRTGKKRRRKNFEAFAELMRTIEDR